MANKQPQQYGLILTNKKQLSTPKAGNVFGNDDDSEEEEGTDWVKKALKAEHEKNKFKKQTQLNMQKALKEDPTIYQYDEVYDVMERTKEEEMKAVKKIEKKPKYINNLLKSAELRKKEQELRKDRMIQKEIEAEDAMFPDKERYVTSSYKAKLEEMKKFEEEQADRDRLEAIVDVTKQKDMSGFYRHLYRQTVEKNEADMGMVSETKKSDKNNDKQDLHPDIDKDDPVPSDSESDESNKSGDEDKKDISKKSALTKAKVNRQYRKRKQEESESESEPEPESKKENQESSEKTAEKVVEDDTKSESGTPAKKQKLSDEVDKEKMPEGKKSSADEGEKEINKTEKESATEKDDKGSEGEKEEKPKPEPPKRKVNIWVKRTVGPVFEAALERYLIRKQQRLAGS